IWVENRVDFGDPVNLVPVAAALILAIGDVTLKITADFPLQGSAFGTIAGLAGYHVLNAPRGPTGNGAAIMAPAREEVGGPVRRTEQADGADGDGPGGSGGSGGDEPGAGRS